MEQPATRSRAVCYYILSKPFLLILIAEHIKRFSRPISVNRYLFLSSIQTFVSSTENSCQMLYCPSYIFIQPELKYDNYFNLHIKHKLDFRYKFWHSTSSSFCIKKIGDKYRQSILSSFSNLELSNNKRQGILSGLNISIFYVGIR